MPIFTYFAVVGSVLIALLFVADLTLEKGSPAIVTSDRVGLPPKPWHPDSIQTRAAAPTPAPDTSPLVLAGQPKDQSVPEALAKVDPAARAARAEASPTKKRVTLTQPPVDHPQNNTWSRNLPRGREFGLSGGY